MIYLNLILCLFVFLGCEKKSEIRRYAETTLEVSSTQSALRWVLPEGWQEIPGQGMRLASFQLISDPTAIDVSIVSLSGPAGGLKANLQRWLGQIQMQVTEDALDAFIAQAQDNIFDFTQLQKSKDQATKSMIAVMIPSEDKTVFIKMNGSIATIKDNKADFMSLVKSLDK